jgi:lantibiotic modifying enzyme
MSGVKLTRNILSLFVLIGFGGQLKAQSTNNFLQYAEGAGHWLIEEVIPQGSNYTWPDSISTSSYCTNLYSGTPGVLTLFSELYESTGNTQYAQFAIGSAQWLVDMAIPEAGGFKWSQTAGDSDYQTGLYTGAAGTGDAFLNNYETFGDSIYLYYAKGAANWLISMAVFDSIDQCKWSSGQAYASYATDIIFGSAGIGLFFLRMYEITQDQEYLNYAQYAGNQLANIAIADGDGYKWSIASSNPDIYTGFSHGCAGIGYFLARLYTHSNNPVHLQYAEGAALWLMDIAEPEADGCKWWLKENASNPFYATGWCHGPAGTCLLFMKLSEVTTDTIYLHYAKLGATWLINNGGYKYDVTICHGVAGVGDFFLEMFYLTEDSLYYDYAEDAALWLETNAEISGTGYCWSSFGGYYTGFSTGTAGVGLFLLKMHHAGLTPLRMESTLYSDASVMQNYPNPFSHSTTIRIDGAGIKKYEHVKLNIYSSSGALVRSLIISHSIASYIEILWDGKNDGGDITSFGTYYARLETEGRCLHTIPMVMIR